ncbi:MAG: histidine phosphatase family protein [Thermodesulfobacteriota bacterium]|nr:histidine phosphatase family protein [Thermodesulfobacteriota bacterium]
MSTLYLIRHGQASFGQSNYDALSDIGHRQSASLAEYLDRSGIVFDAVYTGPQVRHAETAEPFLNLLNKRPQCPVHTEHQGLAEYDFENVLKALLPVIGAEDESFNADMGRMFTDKKAFQRVFETAILRWVRADDPLPGLPTWQAFKDRVNWGLDEIMARDGRGKHVLMFTSGGPIAVAVQKALALSDEMAMRLNWQIVNCSISRFKCTTDRLMVSAFNEHTWLEIEGGEEMVTYR